jgi:hypothetical protein
MQIHGQCVYITLDNDQYLLDGLMRIVVARHLRRDVVDCRPFGQIPISDIRFDLTKYLEHQSLLSQEHR